MDFITKLSEKYFEKVKGITNHSRNKPSADKEQVNHPDHYLSHNMECIDEMIVVFGPKRTAEWCCQTAWKYRYRAGEKDNEPASKDQKKTDWYLLKAAEIYDTYGIEH